MSKYNDLINCIDWLIRCQPINTAGEYNPAWENLGKSDQEEIISLYIQWDKDIQWDEEILNYMNPEDKYEYTLLSQELFEQRIGRVEQEDLLSRGLTKMIDRNHGDPVVVRLR